MITMFWCPKQVCKDAPWTARGGFCRWCGEETSAAPACVCGEPIHPRVHADRFCERCGQHWTGQFIGSRLSVVLGEQLDRIQQQLKERV